MGSKLTRRIAGVAAAVVAPVALYGCADGTHPGDAAVIGDSEISLTRLDDTVKAVSAAQGEAISPATTLQLMIGAELSKQVATKRTVSVTDAEVAAAMSQVVQDPQLLAKFEANPVASAFLHDFARGQIGLIKIGGASGIQDPGAQQAAQKGGEIVTEEAGTIGVSVSPRFGKWTGGRLAPGNGSLSTPFKQSPTPTPPPQ